MTTVTNSETLEQIADKIAADLGYHGGTDNQAALAEAILSALRNEREACAKVAERMAEIHRNYFVQLESKNQYAMAQLQRIRQEEASEIARAIRARTATK